MMNAKPTITTTDWTRNDGAQSTLKQPTLNELLAITFEERQYSRPPQLIWLCMGGYRRSRFAAPHMSANGMARPCSRPARRKVLRGIKKHKEHVPCHTSPHHLPSARSASISVRIASTLSASINAGRSFGN